MINLLKTKLKDNKCYIYFDNLKNIKKISDLIKILNKNTSNGINDFIFDFSYMRSQSFSPAHVSIAGIVQYYQEIKGINITFIEKEGLYIVHTDTKSPLDVMTNQELFKNNIFDKVITFATSQDVAFISEQIISQLKYSIDCEEGVLVGLSWCMNEIMDNVFNHSKASRGYIMGQLHRRKKHIVISIFDTGIGLHKALLESGEYNPMNAKEAIELAIGKGVSGNRKIGQGNGLWGLYQIVKDNKGYLSIMTGNTSVKYDFDNDKITYFNNLPIISKEFFCTRIDFTLNIDNLININKVLDNYLPYEQINSYIDGISTNTGWIDFNVKKEAIDGTGTRYAGKRLKHNILNLAKCDKLPILINFADVDMITSSFADEFIGKLVKELGFVQFSSRFTIINANEYVSALLNKAILMRQN